MIEALKRKQKLILVVVKKGKARRILRALKKAGAEGGTIMPGKGNSFSDPKSFLGIPIESENEVVLTIIPEEIKDKTLSKIKAAVRMDRRGNGIAIVLNPTLVTGVAHLLNLSK
jgi:nitrogen regulatory protein P-II 1